MKWGMGTLELSGGDALAEWWEHLSWLVAILELNGGNSLAE